MATNCLERADTILLAAYLAGARIKHPNADAAIGAKRLREREEGGGEEEWEQEHGQERGNKRGNLSGRHGSKRQRFPGKVRV